MLEIKTKEKIIKKYQINSQDSSSPEVQVALLTAHIKELIEHFKEHPKDLHSKRGLLKMLEKRKKLLRYLKNRDKERYLKILKTLKLKK